MTTPPEQLAAHGQRRIGGVMIALCWLVIIGVVTMLFTGLLEGRHNPNSQISTDTLGGEIQVHLRQNTMGHYVATGTLNGEPVVFLIDTGATDVLIPQRLADQLGIHVGTVSRAVAGKWMQTPRGMIALWRFFAGGTETDAGRDMSWEAIKATLLEIIEGEDKTKPMSDETLAQELKKRGIDIARRTVVKYRQQLGIPPARRRKVFT